MKLPHILGLLMISGSLYATSAFAETPPNCVDLGNGYIRDGVTSCANLMVVNADGSINVNATGSGSLAAQVQGNVAAGVADSGNPVKVGAKFNTTLPIFADGNRTDLQTDLGGNLRVRLVGSVFTAIDGQSNTLAMVAPSNNNTSAPSNLLGNAAYISNGTTWDRARGITGSDGTGLGIQAEAMAPISIAAGAIVPAVSAAVTGGTIFKATPGNLYSMSVTTGGSAGFLLTFNSTTIPADGAVTPQQCIPVAANTYVEFNASPAGIPERHTTGIVGVFSTTGCYTKTISATAFLRAKFQ